MPRILFPIVAAALLAGAASFIPMQADAATPQAKPAPAMASTAKNPPARSSATPARCHDAKGRFTKCAAKATKPKRCRGSKGKFTKCAA